MDREREREETVGKRVSDMVWARSPLSLLLFPLFLILLFIFTSSLSLYTVYPSVHVIF